MQGEELKIFNQIRVEIQIFLQVRSLNLIVKTNSNSIKNCAPILKLEN